MSSLNVPLALRQVMLAVCFSAMYQGSGLAQEITEIDMEVITVKGERVERTLHDTASSVTVFDQEKLSELAGVDRIEQVLDLVPNVQRGSSDIAPTIRGQDSTGVLLGANAFLGGTRPRVTLKVDGRALNFNEFVYGLSSIWDAEQIEVFKGPQTTSQGRNAIAGAIFINTKNPTFDFEGAGRLVVGNYSTRQAAIALSGPLVDDELAARVSVDWRLHDSWMKYAAPDIFQGANREDDKFTSVRTKFLYLPKSIPDLEVLFTYSHLYSSTPQNETADKPYSKRLQNVQNGAQWKNDVDSLIVDTQYQFSEELAITWLNSYANSSSQRITAPGRGDADITAEEYASDVLAYFDAQDNSLNAMLGMSYFVAEQDEVSDLSAFLGFGDFDDKQVSAGFFAEATFELFELMSLTFGARWQYDSQERLGTLGEVSLDYDESFTAFLPKASLSYEAFDNLTIGLSASKGFNPGGTTISFVTGEVDEFNQETLWNYELFSRSHFFNKSLTFSSNIFFTDFSNSQRPLISLMAMPDGTFAEYVEFSNAPSAKSYGVELETVWRVSPNLKLRASLGYLDTEITETLQENDPINGKAFQRSPELSGQLAVQIRPIENLIIDFSLRHNSEYFSDDSNTETFKIDGSNIVDAKITYEMSTFSLFAYLRNAANKSYPVWQFRPNNASLVDPREFGVGIEASF